MTSFPGDSASFVEAPTVDLLLVIDNSGSMDEEQAALAASIGSLVEVLEAHDAGYRIAVTTTDNGNHWCRGEDSAPPARGNFVFSSCRERLDDFVLGADDTDASFACSDICPEAWRSIRQRPSASAFDALDSIEGFQQQLNPGRQVIVGAFAGVPVGYPDVPIPYAPGADGNDPSSFQAQFGVGPGCERSATRAVPPVRLREFASAFADAVTEDGDPALYSVCSPSYSDRLRRFGQLIADQIRPGCMPACVADRDPATSVVEPLCAVTQVWHDDSDEIEVIELPNCVGGTVPDGFDVCWIPLGDPGGRTATADDDLSARCVEEGWNLEIKIVRRDVPRPRGALLGVRCLLSRDKRADCPGLP